MSDVKKSKPEPTFLEQAFILIEESYAKDNGQEGHGMKISDHKLLCRVLDAHENYLDEKIVKRFTGEIAEYHEPLMRVLESLETGQENIMREILLIKKWQEKTEKRLTEEELKSSDFEKRLTEKRERIERLEQSMKVLQPEVIEDIRSMKPFIMALANAFKPWKIAIYIGAVISLFLLIHFIFL